MGARTPSLEEQMLCGMPVGKQLKRSTPFGGKCQLKVTQQEFPRSRPIPQCSWRGVAASSRKGLPKRLLVPAQPSSASKKPSNLQRFELQGCRLCVSFADCQGASWEVIKLSSSALTQAVPDIKVCKTLVLTTRRLYLPLPASSQPSPGTNLKGRCKRWTLEAHSGTD